VIGSAFGVLGAFVDFRRWVTTRYRVTPDRVEMRSGWLVKKHRTVKRDLIRSVDSSAKARHRLFRLRVVHIGSGQADSSFDLDALDQEHAEQLRRQLVTRAQPDEVDEAVEPVEPEHVIARLRRDWIPLNVVSLWAPVFVAGPLFGLYWFLRPFGIDLLGVAGGLLPWESLGVFWSVVLCLAVAFPIGVAMQAGTFVLENWNLVLARVGTAPHTALVTRRGLLNTRTTQRNDDRLRGLAFKEPLVWRWLRLVEIHVLTTGLGRSGGSAEGILPRIREREARELATDVVPDGHRPMEATLLRHPRGALIRRLGLAVYGPALMSAVLLLFVLSGALPGWVWPLPLALLPLTLPLAVIAYRSLGHAWSEPYLVVRSGSLSRQTVALQQRAVVGWTLRQSILQRWGHRLTAGVSTAAGARHYEVSDAGVDQALALVAAASPVLAAHLLEPDPLPLDGRPLSPLAG
jgi:putative membrane protein